MLRLFAHATCSATSRNLLIVKKLRKFLRGKLILDQTHLPILPRLRFGGRGGGGGGGGGGAVKFPPDFTTRNNFPDFSQPLQLSAMKKNMQIFLGDRPRPCSWPHARVLGGGGVGGGAV